MKVLFALSMIAFEPMERQESAEEDNTVETENSYIWKPASNVYLIYGLQFSQSLGWLQQTQSGIANGLHLGLMHRNRKNFLHPYFTVDMMTMNSGDEYPIVYKDGMKDVHTTAKVHTNNHSFRFGVSADIPVKGNWIPRMYFEVGHMTAASYLRIPRPDPGRDESRYFLNSQTLHKDQALMWGGGLAIRREYKDQSRKNGFLFFELSATIWQSGRVEYLMPDDSMAARIDERGTEAYSEVLSDRPYFQSDYYKGYRYSTPFDHLTFRITVGANF